MGGLIDDMATLIDRGGYVMVPLLALSIISLTLIVERTWFWATLHTSSRRSRLALLHDAFRRGNTSGARRLMEDDRSVYGLLARRLLDHGASNAVALDLVESVRPKIDRFMVTLSTIITAAPLLGILGTVIGIIRSFNLLGEQAALTDPRLVATGIAEALLTTALGLVIALMTLFPYMIFRGQADRSVGRMESLIAAAQESGGESMNSSADPSKPPPRSSRTHDGDGAAQVDVVTPRRAGQQDDAARATGSGR